MGVWGLHHGYDPEFPGPPEIPYVQEAGEYVDDMTKSMSDNGIGATSENEGFRDLVLELPYIAVDIAGEATQDAYNATAPVVGEFGSAYADEVGNAYYEFWLGWLD